MSSLTRTLLNASDTERLGAQLASAALAGFAILLRGPLGAGKTTLVEGFVEAIGAGHAASPSFVLAHSYPDGRMPVWHLDLFRVVEQRDIDDLDLSQYLSADAVTLIEWSDNAEGPWPDDRIEIDLAIEGAGRRARIAGFGAGAEAVEKLVSGDRA
jgi:tRNA threonylcarbamoyl adenosine modification protein YjeE